MSGKSKFTFELSDSQHFDHGRYLDAIRLYKSKPRPSKQDLYVAFGPEDMGVAMVIKVPKHPNWTLMLPTDPTLPDTPIECGLTSAFTSRGPIWVWVRDALATICSAVPFAFEFSYEDRDLEGGAWEEGYFDCKQDRFVVRRHMEEVDNLKALPPAQSDLKHSSSSNNNNSNSHIHPKGIAAALNTLPPPPDPPLGEQGPDSAISHAHTTAKPILSSTTTTTAGDGACIAALGNAGRGAGVPGLPVVLSPLSPNTTTLSSTEHTLPSTCTRAVPLPPPSSTHLDLCAATAHITSLKPLHPTSSASIANPSRPVAGTLSQMRSQLFAAAPSKQGRGRQDVGVANNSASNHSMASSQHDTGGTFGNGYAGRAMGCGGVSGDVGEPVSCVEPAKPHVGEGMSDRAALGLRR